MSPRTRLNRIIGPLLANAWTGAIAARLLRNRIPHRGFTIDTSNPVVSAKIKAALLIGAYESGEYRFIRKHLPKNADVLELGGSLGVISCTIRRHIDPARKLVIVEADPRLAASLRENLEINGCAGNAEVIQVAISYDDSKTVSFALGESSVSGRLAADAPHLPTIEVTAQTLSGIVEAHGLTDFCLVSDIEGIEWRMLRNDLDCLSRARLIIMETHDSTGFGGYEDLIAELLATGRFTLIDRHGPVIALAPTAAQN